MRGLVSAPGGEFHGPRRLKPNVPWHPGGSWRVSTSVRGLSLHPVGSHNEAVIDAFGAPE